VNNLLTIKEAAAICKCSPNTLSKAIDEGRLKVIRITSSKKGRRIDPSDLQEFINQCRTRIQITDIKYISGHADITSSLDELLRPKRKRVKSN